MAFASYPAAQAGENDFQIAIGEEFQYKVSWSFIRLGTLKLEVADTVRMDGTLLYHLKLNMDSNPVLFFVNIHSVYETFIDEMLRVHLFYANERIDNILYKTEYRFDYVSKLIHINMTDIKNPSNTIIDTQPLSHQALFDGTGMVFYARANAHKTEADTLTAYFEAKYGKVSINFKGKKGAQKIDALQKPMPTYFIDGEVHMKAIAGLSGPFKGWFVIDSQRPPLIAELKVFIGSVKVELEDWRGWNHPGVK